MDLGGIKFDTHLIELLRGACPGITAFIAEHYVELIHSFVVVNAPIFISIMW